jgi:hypothetical protein
MKSFKDIRESKGGSVYKKKHGKYPVEIKKEGGKFVAYIDGDKLDAYRSEEDAKKGIELMIKEL